MKIILYAFFSVLYCSEVVLNKCLHETCNDCIRDSAQCAWCGMESFNETRCRPSDTEKNWCSNKLINPQSTWAITEDQDFNSDASKNIIQIKPQRLKMKLRPGVPTNFVFYFNAAANYPADVYFLFDGSASMKRTRQKTANQVESFYKMLQQMTNNVNLGFGVFLDKTSVPPVKLKTNETYSFKHKLKLSKNYDKFKDLVDNIEYYNNRAEGGLDALAQTIACKEAIGWRDDSIKIIVYVSNGYYHVSGDGHVGGIVDPYDGSCYLENGKYTKEFEMDYPTVGILNKLVNEKQVIIIFATENRNFFKMLTEEISNAQIIAFKKHEQEIAAKLSKIFKELTRNIILKPKIKSKYKDKIYVSYDPKCNGQSASAPCSVKLGTKLKFNGTINVLKYFEDKHISVDILIQGLNEKLTLDVEIIGECDCVMSENKTCNDGGIKRCGICECYEGRYGKNCECTKYEHTISKEPNCRAPNTTIDCSGYGRCICGICSCEDGHKGQYCQCDNNNCMRDAGGICGGPSRGQCKCGVCECNRGFTGKACNCDLSTASCETGSNMCFGRVDCECNSCQCPPLDDWDARIKQDPQCRPLPCPDCHMTQCQKLEECVLDYVKDNSLLCHNILNITTVNSLSSFNDSTWNTCLNVRGNVGCYTQFVYKYCEEKYGVEIIVQSDFDCRESYYLFSGVCLAALIVIGIGTVLFWKLVNDFRDAREYDRFLKEYEASSSEKCNNPCFTSPTSTFTNPIYKLSFRR